MCLCLGPTGSGKTLLLKMLQNREAADTMASTVPTIGTNLVTVRFGNQKQIAIREVGGAMAPIWRNYYSCIRSIIYVVDASNLCQIAAAAVLLYTILAESSLQKVKVLLVLSKMDASYRQMRNEALLMLQLAQLKKEVSQNITVVEASAMTGKGIDSMLKWLQGDRIASSKSSK
jgi:small GTP-binding protein